jgi:hypothetical protein
MPINTPGPSPARDTSVDRYLQRLNGCPVYAGTVTGSAATSNASTSPAPFALQAGGMYLLQPDTACYVATGPSSAAAIAAVTGSSASLGGGFLVDPAVCGAGFLLTLRPSDTHVAMLPSTGTTNLKVFTLA